ncbi:hypothetical protein M422DRAFT_270902 [Sphaerobolus stellatus SS14]|uniref:F-box domain-containing protein n=1 Tax=Sphaerobolus stellatus (strain SS14) TaxID=990650 RepID=A0A0C9TF15_SPHS4|nr:hypothetical protein M422DRAFT_270902 [Sphaerobolus stellatus SS14]
MDYSSRIPIEILQEIFHHSLPPLFQDPVDSLTFHESFIKEPASRKRDIGSTYPLTFEIACIRTTLRQVCSHWNNAVVHAPQLWNQLDIQADRFINDTDGFKTLLERSKSIPLDVKLQFTEKGRYDGLSQVEYNDLFGEDLNAGCGYGYEVVESTEEERLEFEKGIHDVLTLLRNEFHRIRAMAIHYTNLDQRAFTTHLFPLDIPTSMPRLEYLFGSLLEPHRDYVPFIQNTGPLDTPRLKVCHLHFASAGLWDSLTPSSVSNLISVSVELECAQFPKAGQLLARCQNLKDLSWSISRDFYPLSGTPSAPRISSRLNFPFLTSLHLAINDDEAFPCETFLDIAHYLDAPQLRSLTIEGTPGKSQVRSIAPLLRRNPQLEELRMSVFGVDDYSEDLLAPLVELKTLILSRMKPSNEFLQSSFHTDASSLSNLSKFIIERPEPGWAVSKTLLGIIKDKITHPNTAPMEFHIWTDGHRFVENATNTEQGSSLSMSTGQVERNYGELLGLSERYPAVLQWYKFEHPGPMTWYKRLWGMDEFASG